MCIYLAPYEYYTQRGTVVIASYILKSKGMNHMAYLAHVATDDGVLYCLSNSCAIVFRNNQRFDYQPQFQDQQKPHPLISRRAVRRRHYRSRIKSQKTARSVVGVEPTTFRTAATDNDKNYRLYQNATAYIT